MKGLTRPWPGARRIYVLCSVVDLLVVAVGLYCSCFNWFEVFWCCLCLCGCLVLFGEVCFSILLEVLGGTVWFVVVGWGWLGETRVDVFIGARSFSARELMRITISATLSKFMFDVVRVEFWACWGSSHASMLREVGGAERARLWCSLVGSRGARQS